MYLYRLILYTGTNLFSKPYKMVYFNITSMSTLYKLDTQIRISFMFNVYTMLII